jgi:hydrogenase maturation protein HypF
VNIREQAVDDLVCRVRFEIEGAVQGVGFRPFVYRLAIGLGLTGYVVNSPAGVVIEAEGSGDSMAVFERELVAGAPAMAEVTSVTGRQLPVQRDLSFHILKSRVDGGKTAFVVADIATCSDCVADIREPTNRRYRYPFTNCTNCGPRYSIVLDIPYDRASTTMATFTMCPTCQAEYEDPANRRFHAQPNACSVCGPTLCFREGSQPDRNDHDALDAAETVIRDGGILALKGLGGYQLIVDARDEAAMSRLRQRKHREAKPMAVMAPNLEWVTRNCVLSDAESTVVTSPAAPIVLLERRGREGIVPGVAPGNPYLGVMLPYTPIHHLLLEDLEFPVVATSGNLSEEPICIDDGEAASRLGGIADAFLVHNRPIARPVDDSVVQVVMGRAMVLRRARGYAPLPLSLESPGQIVLATGGHLKSTIAVTNGSRVMLSQHLGDLSTEESRRAYHRCLDDLPRLYGVIPGAVACDLHPDYHSTRVAESYGLPLTQVQHHYAHVLSCMAEFGLTDPVLGVSWDGTGYGEDGTIWGGEFLRVEAESWTRRANLRAFRLPGGESAVREPRRSAIGLLYETLGAELFEREDLAPMAAFARAERDVLRRMLGVGVNVPVTSSAGRLFDALASILGIRQTMAFEGQAAMELEHALPAMRSTEAYPFTLDPGGRLDWEPMVRAVLCDRSQQMPVADTSLRIHNTMAQMIVAVAEREAIETVVLTGGCFQNRYLLESAVRSLRRSGFDVYWNQRVPINDGGIAMGQVFALQRPGRYVETNSQCNKDMMSCV